MTDDLRTEMAIRFCEKALGGKVCPCRDTGRFNCSDETPGQLADAALAHFTAHLTSDAMVERVARSLYQTSCMNDPIEPVEPDWGRGGYKTQVGYWMALARAVIAAQVAAIGDHHG